MFDVVLLFPRETRARPYLWANAASLSEVSGYWASLFDGGFAESTHYLEPSVPTANALDSSLEAILTKHRTAGECPPIANAEAELSIDNQNDTLGPGIRYVVVQDTSMDVYQAVIDWIMSGCIDFGSTPLSVDDKSVYALAHFLHIPALQNLALLQLKAQLKLGTIIPELFSEHSLLYKAWKDTVMQVAVIHWNSIKQDNHQLAIASIIHDARADEQTQKDMLDIMTELLSRVG